MKRLLQLIARLYPRSWRKRYGDEFDALLDDLSPRWSDVANVAWQMISLRSTSMKAWQWIAAGALAGFSVHLAGMYLHSPAGYSSRAIVRISGAGSTSDGYVQTLADSALTRDRLTSLIHTYRLYPEDLAAGRQDAAVEKVKQSIEVYKARSIGNSEAYSIRVLADNPDVAQKATRHVMTLLIDENLRYAAKSRNAPTMEVYDMPNLPKRPVRWMAAERILGYGVLFGGLVGAVVAAGSWAWRAGSLRQ